MKTVIEKVQSCKSPFEVFCAVEASCEICFFLDSVRYRLPDQNHSYIGRNPFLTVCLQKEKLLLDGEKKGVYPRRDLFKILRKIFNDFRIKKSKQPFFSGGGVGFWGYELATLFERVKLRQKPSLDIPDLFLGFYRDLIVYDHRRQCYFVVTHSFNAQAGEKEKAVLRELKGFLKNEPAEDVSTPGFKLESFRPEIDRQKFEAMVRKAKTYIAAGDIYQANLSQRFNFKFQGSAVALYGHLRAINPSPFASFLKIQDLQIVSSSPERLIAKRGRRCETRPIAGTRPRKRGTLSAQKIERDLMSNEKERAEHIMLVDLERNDLGRVCHYRSVKVAEMMTIEKYSHVIHIVSKVIGRLAKGKDGFDLIRAMFPGGTITGCPKIRCMEIIDELEPVQRGVYTGSIGYLDFSGDLDLNIVIRTLVLKKNRGYLQVGAGIVYDSDPRREYEETLHKGEALVEALARASG